MSENNASENTGQGNQITRTGKIMAGIFLILFTASALIAVVGIWPDKMPSIKNDDAAAWYRWKWFGVTLIDSSANNQTIDSNKSQKDSLVSVIDRLKENIKSGDDSTLWQHQKDTLAGVEKAIDKLTLKIAGIKSSPDKKIHLNTILLLLVALMGFLGNMIHVTTSFSTYVGNGTFKRDWILWYWVKPCTAAGMAVIIYFIIRAGFLSYGTSAAGISLYGVLALSALAGLFTDSATLKLKEVFDVIFKPKDERSGKLQGDELIVTSFTPDTIPHAADSVLVLTGKNLNMVDTKITIDGNVVNPSSRTTDKLEVKYKPAAGIAKAVFIIADKTGKALYTKEITIN